MSCANVLTAMSNVNVCVGYRTGGAQGHAGRAGTLSKPSATKQPQDHTQLLFPPDLRNEPLNCEGTI